MEKLEQFHLMELSSNKNNKALKYHDENTLRSLPVCVWLRLGTYASVLLITNGFPSDSGSSPGFFLMTSQGVFLATVASGSFINDLNPHLDSVTLLCDNVYC